MNLFNFVPNLINKVTEPKTTPATDPQLDFLLEILQAIDNDSSPANIYPLLAANQQLLDLQFRQLLQAWAEVILAKEEGNAARNFVIDICTFSNRISDFPLGSRADNLEIAIAGYEIAAKFFTFEALPQDWAMTQNNLGTAYRNRIRGDKGENLELAIACYEAALVVYTFEALPQNWATTQNNLGIAYRNRIRGDKGENLELAIACYEAALVVYTFEALPQDWAMTQNNLGTAYSDRIRGDKGENLELAIACYQAALVVYTFEALPQNHAETSFNLGLAYQDANKLTDAYQTFKSAINTVEFLRGEIVSGDEAKQQHAETWNKLYRRMVEVCLQLNYQQEALQYIERSKTQNLVELIVQQIITQQLQPLETAITEELARLKTSPNLDDSRLKDLETQRQAVINQKPNLSTINFADTQQLLDDRTAILQWYIFADCFRVFIITRHHSQPIIWQSSKADLEALETWTTEYLKSYTENKTQWRNQLNTRLETLAQILHRDALLELLHQNFSNCQSLILVPHRYLHLFPLHALPVASNEYLLDKFPGGVRYAPSCTLLKLAETENRPTELDKLFAINNPNDNLTYTNIEVTTIARQFANKTVLTTGAATRQAVLNPPARQSLETSPWLHFSCHGYFNWKTPLNSALALADCCLSPVPNDIDNNQRYLKLTSGDVIDIEKCLSLADIFNLELSQCNLVTLSACETGISDPFSSSDEYIGLPSGFLKAGSSSVVSSLWAVDDFSTALLMMQFYANLNSGDYPTISQALIAAQKWLREVTQSELLNWLQNFDLDSQHRQDMQEYIEYYYRRPHEQPFQDARHWAGFCSIGCK